MAKLKQISGTTSGSMIYIGSNGKLNEDVNIYWDDVNSRMGIGNQVPTAKLHIRGNVSEDPLVVDTDSINGVLSVNQLNEFYIKTNSYLNRDAISVKPEYNGASAYPITRIGHDAQIETVPNPAYVNTILSKVKIIGNIGIGNVIPSSANVIYIGTDKTQLRWNRFWIYDDGTTNPSILTRSNTLDILDIYSNVITKFQRGGNSTGNGGSHILLSIKEAAVTSNFLYAHSDISLQNSYYDGTNPITKSFNIRSEAVDLNDRRLKITPNNNFNTSLMEIIEDTALTSNKTVMKLLIHDGTNTVIKDVEVGPPDSAGAGYRALRVTN